MYKQKLLKSCQCFFLAIVLFLSVFSCKDDFAEMQDEETFKQENFAISAKVSNSNNMPDVHTKIVLGNKLDNPYSVVNMQSAFDYYNNNVSNSEFDGREIAATHYYIKITPNTVEELEIINSLDDESNIDTPVLHDHPVDYEVLQEGDYYVDPTNEEDLYHPIYTTIPVNYQLPDGINYEILEELYEPTDDEFKVETVSLYFAQWNDDLEADNIILNNEDELQEYLTTTISQKSSNKFYPSGKITIENTGTALKEGLMKAEISYGRVFWWHYTYTDNLGNFNGTAKKYRGNVEIRAKWRGNTATIRKSWNEVLGFAVSDHLMTLNKNNNGAEKYLEYSNFNGLNNHKWAKGTVNNGLRKYVDYCNSNGITNTISHANVWVKEGIETASTPMLYKFPQLSLLSTVANVGQANFWYNLTSVFSGLAISLVPSHLRPDQIFSGVDPKIGETRTDSRRIHQLVFHESAHYSHAVKAGSWYWAQVFAGEISNFIISGSPYQDGSYPSMQSGARIGLAEGWATYAEYNISHHYYLSSIISTNNGRYRTSASVANGILEGFSICDRPMSITRTDERSWFAHGLMFDLMDAGRNNGSIDQSVHRNGNGAFLNNILDEVNIQNTNNNYNLAPIFSRLTSSVHSAADLKSPLQAAYPGQSSQINTLFQNYGY